MTRARSTPSVVGVVVARLDSQRLPGKALIEVGGVPLIGYVLQRAKQVRGLAGVALATTTLQADDPLCKYAESCGATVFRGQRDDVAGRVHECARSNRADYFLRINGDSPFVDPELVSRALVMCSDGEPDLVTNLVGRTYPYGVAVEVVRTTTFGAALDSMIEPDDREHVTRYLYRNEAAYDVRIMHSDRPDLNEARMVVDTPADLDVFRAVVESLGDSALETGYVQAAECFIRLVGRDRDKARSAP